MDHTEADVVWLPMERGILPTPSRACLLSLHHYDGSYTTGVGVMSNDLSFRLLIGTPGDIIAWASFPAPYWVDDQGG